MTTVTASKNNTTKADQRRPEYYVAEIGKRLYYGADPDKTPEIARTVFFENHPEFYGTPKEHILFEAGFEYASNLLAGIMMMHMELTDEHPN